MTIVGRIDRYVGRTVLEAYLGALVFMVFLSILVDMLMNMSRYLQIGEEYGISFLGLVGYLAEYYTVLMPFLFVTIAPFVTVIACMFAVSRLMSSNEIAPMIFTGRSLYRILHPVLLIAIASALLMAACWEEVIPRLAETKATQEYVLGSHDEAKDVLLQSPANEGRHLRAEGYYHDQLRMEVVTLYDEGSLPGDVEITEADEAYWRPEQGDWELVRGILHRGEDSQPQKWLRGAAFTPELLWRSGKESKESAELSYTDLLELQELRPNSRSYVLAFHHHVTFPLANLVLLLLALPFALHFERGSRIGRVVFAIVICGGYLTVDLICQSLGQAGDVHPVVAAWIPTIFFTSLGVVFFSGIRT